MVLILKLVALLCFLTSAFQTQLKVWDNVRLGALGLAFWLVATMVADRHNP